MIQWHCHKVTWWKINTHSNKWQQTIFSSFDDIELEKFLSQTLTLTFATWFVWIICVNHWFIHWWFFFSGCLVVMGCCCCCCFKLATFWWLVLILCLSYGAVAYLSCWQAALRFSGVANEPRLSSATACRFLVNVLYLTVSKYIPWFFPSTRITMNLRLFVNSKTVFGYKTRVWSAIYRK